MAGTKSGMLSRVYFSSAIESTAGVLSTLNKSFYVKSCNVNYSEDFSKDEVITGYLNDIGITRERVKAMGNVTDFLHPDIAAWAFKMICGAAPNSALVSPSMTVYEHTFNAITLPPATFSMQ